MGLEETMSTASARRSLSVAEYLAIEDASPTKHEYYQGEMFAMAGATIRHNDISGNIYHALRNQLKGTPCRPYASDQRISIRKAGLYTYSDTVVICGTIQRDPEDKQAATNPRVIFEVLSKSTESYDRGKKWEFYQQLDSLREYLLVSQEDAIIAQFYRQDSGTWQYRLINGLDRTLQLESLGCQLPLTEIYDHVTFGPEELTTTPTDEGRHL